MVMSAADNNQESQVAFGTDERRMQVRAYNYWSSLLQGRDYPSIEDLESEAVTDFSPHSVLLHFTEGLEDPSTPFIGAAIREECDLSPTGISKISEVPRFSLLSRLTDHYLQIIANRAPVGFEARFDNQRNQTISYRGILMPFSSDGMTIDYIYGVINWKTVAGTEDAPPSARVLAAVLPPLNDEGDEVLDLVVEADAVPAIEAVAVEASVADVSSVDEPAMDLVDTLAEDEGLADRLSAARESAALFREADGRSHAALYRALSMAYDFALATRRVPDQYAEILEDAGIKLRSGALMTPIVKLVFGAGYDKTRLTEFASVLSHAQRADVPFGELEAFIGSSAGGLKGIVAAERKARRPHRTAFDALEVGRRALQEASPVDLGPLPDEEELVLVLVRRSKARGREDVGVVTDQAVIDRAIRQFAQ